jgi:histidine kinase
LKYTKDGTISIYLKAPDVLCIQDTGIGIAPEDLPRVFDKGYTGYNGRKDKKASGLGLYLCKKICARLGLKIYLESKPGEGTRVMIDFEQYKLNAE